MMGGGMMEEAIKAEMRLFVLETLVALLYAQQAKTSRDPAASVQALRAVLIEKAQKQTFAGVDPSLSDLLSAELEAAVDAALRKQMGWLGPPPAR